MKRTDWKYLVDSLLFISFFGLALIGILMGFFIASLRVLKDKYFLGLHRHQWGDIHLYLALTFVTLGIIHLILSWSWIKGKAKNIFKSGWKIMMTATVLAGLLVVVLFWAFSPKNSSVYEGYGLGRGRNLQAGESRISTPAQEKEMTAIQAQSQFPVQAEAQSQVKEPAKVVDEDIIEEKTEEKRAAGGRISYDTSEIVITGRMSLKDVERVSGIPAQRIIEALSLQPGISLNETLGRLRKIYPFTIQQVREVVEKERGGDVPQRDTFHPDKNADTVSLKKLSRGRGGTLGNVSLS